VRKLADGEGLALVVMPSGSRYWRLKYRYGGTERSYSIGTYPNTTLAEARAERARAKDWLKAGLDPVAQRRVEKASAEHKQATTFAVVAEEWYASKRRTWKDRYAVNQRKRLNSDLLPTLGGLPLADVTAPVILKTLRKLEAREVFDTLIKCRVMVGMVFRYAIATGRASDDPTRALKGAFTTPHGIPRATVPVAEFPALFKALHKVPGEPTTNLALAWLIATATRTGETRFATWGEIEHDKLWRIGPERMKRVNGEAREHVVPVSPLMQAILKRAQELRTSDDADALLFPGFTRHGALSENALLAMLARAGYFGRQTSHGFRSAFSTWANESGADPAVVERALAHKQKGVAGIYNRGAYIEQRRALLARWGAFLVEQGLRLP
jgi:integrase